jgi:hypothetical protein
LHLNKLRGNIAKLLFIGEPLLVYNTQRATIPAERRAIFWLLSAEEGLPVTVGIAGNVKVVAAVVVIVFVFCFCVFEGGFIL